MHSPQSSWFSEEEAAGLPDFARVYDEHFWAISESVLTLMRKDPSFAVLLEGMSAEQLVREQQEALERFRRAMGGDWRGYLETLNQQGQTFARMGVPLLSWQRATKGATRKLVTLILGAYAKEPERQRLAMLGMQAFFDWANANLANVYLAASEEALLKSETR